MSHPYYHAKASVKSYGGSIEDYMPIHQWLDASKQYIADVRHRALRHHAQGIFECEREFGITIENSDGKKIPVRIIAEQHIVEDLGRVPSLNEWLECLPCKAWMNRTQKLSKELEDD